MPRTQSKVQAKDGQELSVSDLLRALVVLTTATRDELAGVDRSAARGDRSDVVLARAGFAPGQIASMTGKNYEAVRATLRRVRESGAKSKGVPGAS